jgi:hypothetical protein
MELSNEESMGKEKFCQLVLSGCEEKSLKKSKMLLG